MFLLSVVLRPMECGAGSTENKKETNSLRSLRLNGDYKLSNKPVSSNRYQVTPQGSFDKYGQRKVIFLKKKAEWPLKKQATLEILNECPSYNEERLSEFYKRMGFPASKN